MDKKLSSFILTILWFSFIISPLQITAQDYTLIQKLPAKNASFATDYLGNLYLINDYNLSLYDSNGNFIKKFEEYKSGKISSIDVSNPLKILVYYADFMIVKVLDKTLSEIASFSLNEMEIYTISAISKSREDNFWIFDNASFQLKKVNENGEIISSSESFNLLFTESIIPSQIIDYEYNIYLLDHQNGVFVFDRFGTYQKTIGLINLTKIQLFKNLIVYFKDSNLYSYNTLTFEEQGMELPEIKHLKEAQIQKDRIFIQDNEMLYIYVY